MSRYIVPDTCALATSLFNEQHSANADPLLAAIRSQSVDAVSPSCCFTEFFNVARKKIEGAQGYAPLPASQVEAVVTDFLSLPIVWMDVEPLADEAWRLYRRHEMQTGDAFFVIVARLWQAELWTKDNQLLRTAPSVHGKIFDLKVTMFT